MVGSGDIIMRLRLFFSFFLIVVISVTGVVLIARYSSARAVRSFMFGGEMADVEGLVNNLAEYYRANASWQGVESWLPALSGRQSGMGMGHGSGGQGSGGMMGQRLRLADADGNLVTDSAGLQPGSQLTQAELAAAAEIVVDGKIAGYFLAQSGLGYSAGDEQFLVGRLTQAAISAGLVAGGLSLLLSLGLAYRLLRPIREMTGAASRLGKGDLSQRVRVSGSDELAVLGQTFNHMADSLQQAEQSRRAMTADIAHELRNPLAVQRANLEALQDGIYPLNSENLQPVLEQNLYLSRLVDDLRTLALADSGQLILEQTPTDLLALASRVVDRFRPQAAAHQITLNITAPQSAPDQWVLTVDPMRVEQIVTNLLSNALRYTPPDGKVELALQRLPVAVQLTVQDSGPGIPEESLAHVFERFYRADRSRSRAEGGTGLGLAIARQLTEAHKGKILASNHPLGGAVFTLVLPAG